MGECLSLSGVPKSSTRLAAMSRVFFIRQKARASQRSEKKLSGTFTGEISDAIPLRLSDTQAEDRATGREIFETDQRCNEVASSGTEHFETSCFRGISKCEIFESEDQQFFVDLRT